MTPEFVFDFGSPNAYLVHRVLPEIERRTSQKFAYKPILLGGLFKLSGNQSPITAYAEIKNKLAYQRLELERFVKRHRLEAFRDNQHFPVNTLHLMRGCYAAEALDVFPAYVEAMFVAMWEKGLKMDDPQVIGKALAEAGLPAKEIIVKTQEQPIKDALLHATQAAYERGAFGAPTFFVGDEMFFGKDRLADVEAEIGHQRGG